MMEINTMMFYNNFSRYGDKIALIEDSGLQITYCQLEDHCHQIGKKLKKRSLAFVICENSIGSLLGYLSLLSNNMVVALFDSKMDISLIHNLMETYHPKYLYIPEKLSNDLISFQCLQKSYGYQLLETNYGEIKLNDQLALLLTTSGSTGSSQLVRLSYDNLQNYTKDYAKALNLDETERPITTIPMSFTYGLAGINAHLYVGATILVTMKSFIEKSFWDFLSSESATSIAGVPYSYEMLKKINFFKMKLPSLRMLTECGGKLPDLLFQDLVDYADKNNKKFMVIYGQTEACLWSYLTLEDAIKKNGSMGTPFPGCDFSIVDDLGNHVKTSEVGELICRNKYVALGYAETADDLQKGDSWNGEFRTGDYVKCDEDNFLYFISRKKRFVKVYGERVSLDSLENLLLKQYKGLECICTGNDDKIQIHLVSKDVYQEEELILYLSNKTKINSNVFKVNYIDEIPRTNNGKISYAKIKTQEKRSVAK